MLYRKGMDYAAVGFVGLIALLFGPFIVAAESIAYLLRSVLDADKRPQETGQDDYWFVGREEERDESFISGMKRVISSNAAIDAELVREPARTPAHNWS